MNGNTLWRWTKGLVSALAVVLAGLTQWLPGAVLASVAALTAALWLWAGTDNSLRQTLELAKPLVPELESLKWTELDATLREGGQAQQLTWHRDGLTVVVTGARLRWDFLPLLLGQPLALELLASEVRVTDQRPSSTEPMTPPESLELPLAVGLNFDIGTVTWASHPTAAPLTVTQHLRGRYTHGDDAQGDGLHRLQVLEWTVAQGHYHGEVRVGTSKPMAVKAELSGTATPANTASTDTPNWQAQVTASASGDLDGPQASLCLSAQVDSPAPGPRADLQARLQPWQPQPLLSLAAQLQRLDLATFWPGLPSTQLSGHAQATPVATVGPAGTPGLHPTRWAVTASLVNSSPGPWDSGHLPVGTLAVQAEGNAASGHLTQFKASSGGGSMEGKGTWQGSAWQGSLQAQGLRLDDLDTRLPSAQLNGTAQAKQVPRTASTPSASTEATLNLVAQALPKAKPDNRKPWVTVKRQASLVSRFTWNGQQLGLPDLRLAWDGSTLQAQGKLTPAKWAWEGETRLQVPGLLANSQGLLASDAGLGQLAWTLENGNAFNKWLGSLPGLDKPWADTLPVAQGDGDIQWQGGWRNPAFQIRAKAQVTQIQAPASTHPAWGGQGLSLSLDGTAANWQASVNGRLHQEQLQAQVQANLQGQTPAWHPYANEAPSGSAPGAVGPAKTNTPTPSGSPSASGTGLAPWGITVSQLSVALGPRQGDPALRMDSPQAIALTGHMGSVRLAAGALQLHPSTAPATTASTATSPAAPPAPASIAWQDSTWGADGLTTSGQFSGLRPDRWAAVLARLGTTGLQNGLSAAGLGGDLALQGQWQLAWPGSQTQPPQVRLSIDRQSGDLQVDEATLPSTSEASTGSAPRLQTTTVPLGLTQASAELRTQGEDLSLRWQWDSARAGRVQAQWNTRLTPGPHTSLQGWLPQRSAPLKAQVKAQMSDIGVWSRLAPPGWRLHGRLGFESTLSGTLGQPDWHGELQADALELRSVVEGLAFGNGTLRATLGGNRMDITQFSLEGAGGAATGGTLQLTGQAVWPAATASGDKPAPPSLMLQATAQRLRVSARADRRLTVSGQTTAQLSQGLLTLRGKLRADQAQFTLPDETAPSLGPDVVVRLNRAATPAPATPPMRTDVAVQIDLGPQFELQGQGLQTRLSGELNVSSPPRSDGFQVVGEVRAVKGTYRAYGQLLRIEDGVLRFSGPYDDPSLDVLALRGKGQPGTNTADSQQVGVQITGSARAPRVALYASPDLPDSEKLAWLVLGRPATGVGAEAAVLQQAALALLSNQQGRGMDAGLAAALGLDDISLHGSATSTANGSTTQSTALSLGKRLSSKMYVTYEQSLTSAVGVVNLFYEVSRHLTVRAQAGQASALDLIFSVQHD